MIFFFWLSSFMWQSCTHPLSHKRGWISQLCQLWACGKWIWGLPPFFSAACMHDKIGSCGNSSTLKTFFSAASSHSATSALFFLFFFPTLISTEETSQCRSCPSQTWGSACWECFWGSCWRSPLMDPTPCRAHPGGSKVRLDYTSY